MHFKIGEISFSEWESGGNEAAKREEKGDFKSDWYFADDGGDDDSFEYGKL